MTGAETCNEIRCGFSLPYCIRVPEEEISFPYKDIQCVLIFSRVARRDSSEELIPGMMDGYLDVVTQDRFGRYDFSKVTLVFRRNYFDYDPTFDDKKVLDLALKVLNRFLQFYRRAYDEYWVIGVTQMDILHFWMGCYMDGVNVPGLMTRLGNGAGNVILPWKSYLEQKAFQRLECYEKLKANYELPLYIRALMEGTRLTASGSADLGVIMFDRSFELYFDTLVTLYLQKNGALEDEWESYISSDLVGNANRKRSSKLMQYSSKVSPSGRLFWNEEQTFREWKDHCRDIRNGIAHGRVTDISPDEAIRARKAVWDAFEFFGFCHLDEVVVTDEYTDATKFVRSVGISFP